MDLKTQYSRAFLNLDDDMGDPETIKKAYAKLENLPVDTKEQAAAWLDVWNEIMSAIGERMARVYFDMTKNTKDEDAAKEYGRLANEVMPLAEELDEAMKKRFLALPKDWVPKEYDIARQNIQLAVELFRKENLPLISKEMNFRQEYQQISGAWETEFEGKKVTPSMLRPYLKKPDRAIREKAWRASVGMHLADKEKLDVLFDKMLENRQQKGKNAGYENFIGFQYKNMQRLSYGPADTKAFRDAIHKYVVPAVNKIIARRMEKLGLDSFRPWDSGADPDGAEPPKVYEDLPDLKKKAASVLTKIDPEFEESFWFMDKMGYLDLENRPGKAPGAYSNDFAEERTALIFGNAVGTSGDFDTLLHESGHSIHTLSCRHLPLLARSYPLEFAEVASMSLELLARPYWNLVYKPDDEKRIGIEQLEDLLLFLPFMAMLDEFQDWVYSSPEGADSNARDKYWIGLAAKYMPHVDYSGLEKEQARGWQYLHVYEVPLYYIEYGIAQVGAMQVFVNSLENYDQAVKDYKYALTLGTTVGLPELFEAAGVKFVLKHPDQLERVTNEVMKLINLA